MKSKWWFAVFESSSINFEVSNDFYRCLNSEQAMTIFQCYCNMGENLIESAKLRVSAIMAKISLYLL